jgi:hypothetical protein
MFFALLAQPVMVKVVEQPVETTSVADVLIGAFGLSGVLIVLAITLGGLLGGTLILIKKLRARYNLEPVSDSDALKIT